MSDGILTLQDIENYVPLCGMVSMQYESERGQSERQMGMYFLREHERKGLSAM